MYWCMWNVHQAAPVGVVGYVLLGLVYVFRYVGSVGKVKFCVMFMFVSIVGGLLNSVGFGF